MVGDDRGRWRKDPSRPVILFYGGRERPLQFDARKANSELEFLSQSIAQQEQRTAIYR
jgi:hypothetical protein